VPIRPEQWVEQGLTPGRIVASHSTDGAIDRTRPLCAYPEVARYTGSGSPDEAETSSARSRDRWIEIPANDPAGCGQSGKPKAMMFGPAAIAMCCRLSNEYAIGEAFQSWLV